MNHDKNFPPPLSLEDEKKLIEQYANGDEKAKEKLIKHNLRIAVFIAKRFNNKGVSSDDLVDAGTRGLEKAVDSYSPDMGIQLATYIARKVENEILMLLRSQPDFSLDQGYGRNR